MARAFKGVGFVWSHVCVWGEGRGAYNVNVCWNVYFPKLFHCLQQLADMEVSYSD